MPRAIINGTQSPILTGRRISYDKTKGLVVTQDYETAGDNLNGIAQDCFNRQIQFEYKPSARKSSLSFTSADSTTETALGNITSDTWQLRANETQKDIKEHPNTLNLPVNPADGSLEDILKQVALHDKGETAIEYAGQAGRLYRLMIHGVTSYALGQTVLLHTTNVSDRYDNNVAQFGVESIYTTENLIQEIMDPTYWIYPCPGLIVSFIQGIQIQIPTNDDLIWGWRKLPSQISTAANNRVDISTEYCLAAWSRFLYRPFGGEFPTD